MRGPLKKEMLACFKKQIETRLSQFKPIPENRDPWIWEWRVEGNRTFFVLLQPMEKRDQFTVEVSWSESGQFPWGEIGTRKIDRPIGRLRLPNLWAHDEVGDVWDVDPAKSAGARLHLDALRKGVSGPYPVDSPIDQILPGIPALVIDAVDKLVQFGLPLFQQVAEVRKWRVLQRKCDKPESTSTGER